MEAVKSMADTDLLVNEQTLECTVQHLHALDYTYLGKIGYGSFSSVIEVSHPNYDIKLAAKIVPSDFTTEGEISLWPSIRHQNIQPLLNSHRFMPVNMHVFIMPYLPMALEVYMNDPSFQGDVKCYERAEKWMKEILLGLDFLHTRCLCHLDLKINNVMISDTDTAQIIDLGFLKKPKGFVTDYGSPFMYRPPEARQTPDGLTPVNGFSYDVWTVGLLALETFTSDALVKSLLDNDLESAAWPEALYTPIYDILQREKFKLFMKKAFKYVDLPKTAVKNMHRLIMGCLQLNPRKRPTVRQILNSEVFKGHKKLPAADRIWNKKETSAKIQIRIGFHSLYTLKHKPPMSFYGPSVECVTLENNATGDDENINHFNRSDLQSLDTNGSSGNQLSDAVGGFVNPLLNEGEWIAEEDEAREDSSNKIIPDIVYESNLEAEGPDTNESETNKEVQPASDVSNAMGDHSHLESNDTNLADATVNEDRVANTSKIRRWMRRQKARLSGLFKSLVPDVQGRRQE